MKALIKLEENSGVKIEYENMSLLEIAGFIDSIIVETAKAEDMDLICMVIAGLKSDIPKHEIQAIGNFLAS